MMIQPICLKRASTIYHLKHLISFLFVSKIIAQKHSETNMEWEASMKLENFEIKCAKCGSEDVVIITRRYDDCQFVEEITIIKCKHCHVENRLF